VSAVYWPVSSPVLIAGELFLHQRNLRLHQPCIRCSGEIGNGALIGGRSSNSFAISVSISNSRN
jgi:hypothetical protein